MDLRRLEIFCKLIETRSFSLTAEELNLTQPTVSGHIKILEQEIGLRLFDRHRRQVQPTAAAMVLQDYALRMLELRNEAGYALDKYRGRIAGNLRLGGSTIPGTYILPQAFGRFHREYPETRLSLLLGDTRDILKQVSEGEVEIGMVGADLGLEGLRFEPYGDDEMVLAVPANQQWIEAGSACTVHDLVRAPFIIREEGSGTRVAMLKALEAHGLTAADLNISAEVGSTEAVRQTVSAGLGVSIISRVAVIDMIKLGSIDTIDIEGLDLRRKFYVAYQQRRTRSPLCNAFLEFMKTFATEPQSL